MVKHAKNLGLFGTNCCWILSILQDRKHKQAEVISNSRGLHSISILKRTGLRRKAGSSKRGLRKSSSLTNGIGPVRNKTALKEYGIEARGLHLSCDFVHAPILGTPVNGSL